MRKGAKLVICPKCGKKGLIRNNNMLYIYADCRYCKHHVKAGWVWNATYTNTKSSNTIKNYYMPLD